MRFGNRRNILIHLTIAACAALAGGMAWGQSFPIPGKPIRIIVPTSVGGGNDFIARTVAKKLGESMNVSVVVENRPGASTTIASDHVAKSAPDGHTILFNGPPLVQVASLYKKLPFDPLKDFIPLTDVIRTPLWFVVSSAKVPVKTLAEFSELAKSKGRADSYASVGAGTSLHLFGHGLNEAAKLNMLHVPYKGGAPAMVALVGGEVSSIFIDYATIKPFLADGKVRMLAVTGTKRSPLTPEVPTLSELGFSGFEAYGWGALFLPARTPNDIVAKLYSEVQKVLQQPDMIASMNNMAFEMGGTPQAEFTTLVRTDHDKWARLIKASGVSLD